MVLFSGAGVGASTAHPGHSYASGERVAFC